MPSSRVDKFEKRRKNTKRLSFLLILAGVLVIILIGFLIFGGGNETSESDDQETEHTSEESQSKSSTESANNSENAEDKDDTDEDSNSESDKQDEDDELDKKEAEPSDDNVQKAYTADWDPVGTEQTGPHTVHYNDGSQDRKEMRKAVAAATDLNENNFIMWYAERNGDQQVINTVSDPDENEIYRVYNKWVKNKGWQPTKVEKLKENDRKQQ